MHKHVHTYANIGKIVDNVNKMVTNLATQQMAAEGSLITYSLNNKSNTKLSTISIQYNINIKHTHIQDTTHTSSLPHQSVIWSSSSKHNIVSSPSCSGSQHETLAWLIQCAQSALGNWSCYQHTSDTVQSSLSPPAWDPSMPQSLVSLLPWYRGTECSQGG